MSKKPSEKVIFNIGYGKGEAKAEDLINTSSIPLHNEKMVLLDGKRKSTGYFSHSALESYTRCAKQYEFKYIKREKGRLTSKVKMYGGIVVHDALDKIMQMKIDGKKADKETFLLSIVEGLKENLDEYNVKFAKEKKEGLDPDPLSFGSNVGNQDAFTKLYLNVAATFFENDYKTCTPVESEGMFIHHLDIESGGTLPIVGFIDLVEKYGKGEALVDYKVGAKKSQEDADVSNQLTLYSMAKGITHVGIVGLKLGTTGGKNPSKAKPGEIQRFMAKRGIKDYERATDNMNAILKGIKAGAFPRSGMHNPIVCARSQCPYFDKCLKNNK